MAMGLGAAKPRLVARSGSAAPRACDFARRGAAGGRASSFVRHRLGARRRKRHATDMFAAPTRMLDGCTLMAGRGAAGANLFSTSPNRRRGRSIGSKRRTRDRDDYSAYESISKKVVQQASAKAPPPIQQKARPLRARETKVSLELLPFRKVSQSPRRL
jgi:hypothetical protein